MTTLWTWVAQRAVGMLGIASVVLLLATTWTGCRAKRLAGELVETRQTLAIVKRDRDQYAHSAQRADTVITQLESALQGARDQARDDSLRLVRERNWWARRSRKDQARLDSLWKSLQSDSTLVCDDLFSRSW